MVLLFQIEHILHWTVRTAITLNIDAKVNLNEFKRDTKITSKRLIDCEKLGGHLWSWQIVCRRIQLSSSERRTKTEFLFDKIIMTMYRYDPIHYNP